MKIWVSSLALVHDTARKAKPSRAVSLLSPGDEFPTISGLGADRHHRIHLHDIREPLDGHVTPSGDHVRALLDFLKGWRNDEPLLVHCWAGISRSTATAFIAACLHNPGADEQEIAHGLRAASPTAFPNTRIVAFADDLMKRGGRMSAAIDAMGRGEIAEEAEPFSISAIYSVKA
ncbi:MAG: protein-tyrosine phosphatase family protein [Pseudomonadota bacterium]|nr:protein-tyrosine phosphatase family protein [Pseudomonadota bacterium]